MPDRSSLATWLVGAALGLAAIGTVLFATAPEPEARAPEVGSAAVPVTTLRVEPRQLRPETRVSAVLEPRRAVNLYAETSGRVLEIGAEELDLVQAGQLLVALDPLKQRVAVARAEAQVARSESQLSLATANLQRLSRLKTREAASARALDEARNNERVASAELRQARAALDESRDALERTRIVAPFEGTLRSFPLEEGEYVAAGTRVAELLDLSSARLLIALSDREIVRVVPGADVRVEVEAFPGESFEGRVSRVGSAADAVTRRFPVEIELPNPDGRLLPGMVARAVVRLGEAEPRTLVPRHAVLEEFGLRFVYVLEQDGEVLRARRRRVTVRPLPFEPAALEVTEGVQAGDEVVVRGARSLRDGALVERRAEGRS